MDEPRAYDLIVVGGGVGGSAAALRAAQYNLRLVWLRGTPGTAKSSRGKYVYNIDNMIGVHSDIVVEKVRAALENGEHAAAREFLQGRHFHIGTQDIADNAYERILRDWAHNVEMLDEEATDVERLGGLFRLRTRDGTRMMAHNLVLATGVMDRQPSVQKELKSGRVIDDVRWIFPFANYERLLYCIRCEGHLTRDTPTVVIGADELAAQITLMLHERYGTPVTLLTNGVKPGMADDTQRLLEAYGIEVATERIVDLEDVPRGRDPESTTAPGPRGSELHAVVLAGGRRVPASYGMVAMGLYRVYNELARQLGAELEPGDGAEELRHVLIDDRTSETSVPGLFTVGDMSRRRDGGPSMKQVYTAQEYAVRAVDAIDRRIRAARRRVLLKEIG